MKLLARALNDGARYLLRIHGKAKVTTADQEANAPIRGEVVIEVRGDHPTRRGVFVPRLGLAVGSVRALRGDTGPITVIAKHGDGMIAPEGDDSASMTVDMAAAINHESLDEARGIERDKGCYYRPAFEPAAAHLRARPALHDGRLVLDALDLRVVCAAGESQEVLLIQWSARRAVLRPLLPAPASHANINRVRASDRDANNNACDPSLEVNKRKLVCQPVGFKSSATDASPSGGSATAQFATAQSVWEKACIEIEMKPITYIEDATLKTSTNLSSIRAAYTDTDPDVVEVFFVDSTLPAVGGGSAGGIGVASCKPVIGEPNAGNPVLLAHELGHVLNLLHPGAGSNSDAGTVMAPTGSAAIAGTEFVTHFMTTDIANPVLETLTDTCCLSHDIGDHYIRDFPVDVGSEPSDPLPAGMTRYSMSNVWNRWNTTPGGWNAATGPDHQHPYRYEADGTTPYTNYLFATVDQLINLKVRDAEVRFYLKHPGSGGGATNIQLIGSVPVPAALAVGTSQTVNLPWQVPPGTPAHSCCFAVVGSPAEPEGDQSGLNWWQFESLSREDNDWAQRNLDIIPVAPSGPNAEDSNSVASAPWIIRIPPDQDYDRMRLSLRVDASAAAGLETLALEIPGHERIEVKRGQVTEVTPETPLIPGQDYIVVIQGVIPAKAQIGAAYSVAIDPILRKLPLAGFACTFRASTAGAAVRQVLDRAMAGLRDLAMITELQGARQLVMELSDFMSRGPAGLRELADLVARLAPQMSNGTLGLTEAKAAQSYDLANSVSRLQATASKYGDGLASPNALVESFRDTTQRIGMVAAELWKHPSDFRRDTVRVVVDRLEVLYDHDLVGPGECYFESEVTDAHGRTVTHRFPECGTYRIDAGCKVATVQLEETVYEGAPGGELKVVFSGREVDLLSPDDRFTTHERTFRGSAADIVGTQITKPGDGGPQGMPDWRVFYRIV